MIGQLFGKAAALYKRDVLWLIVAGLIVALILGGITLLNGYLTGASLESSLQEAFGPGTTSSGEVVWETEDTGALGDSAAILGIAVLVLGAVYTLLQMILMGGLYEMVIAGEREGRTARLGDLFSGFRRLGAYIVLALLAVGVGFGVFAVLFATGYMLGPFVLLTFVGAVVFGVWILIAWVYAIPLIVDRRMGAVEAVKESMSMVRAVGWWRTFGMLVLLGLLWIAGFMVLGILARDSQTASTGLSIIFQMFMYPFAVCYIATMYLGSGPSVRPAEAQFPRITGGPTAPTLPPGYEPPAGYQPAPGAYQAPAPGAHMPAPPPPAPSAGGVYFAPVPAPPRAADADAWRAAADPLAAAAGTTTATATRMMQGAAPMADDHSDHDHQTPGSQIEPGVDAASGRLEQHCSQCGTLIEGSDEFCQSCAIEVSGGEPPEAPPAPEAP